jgi:acyl-coenzyme A synthetase/AMP-(fatty) acid ligase
MYIIDNIQKINDIEINDTFKKPPVNNENNRNCMMLFSSGTTGNPKGIVHSVMSLITSAESFAQLSGINTKSIVYHHFPMFYMAGIFNMFLCPMVSGGKVVLGKRFSAEQMLSFWDTPMKYGVNNLTLTPTMAISLVRIYRHDEKIMTYIQNIGSIVSTGSYLHGTAFTEFQSKFSIPLQSCYGVTEAGGTITYKNKRESIIKNQDSVGYFDKNIKFICNGTKHQPNEIRVKTPFMMSGYFINGKIKSGLKDGYFYTGDIGYIENARLFVTGRKGDRIKKGGEFVSLSYIEDIIMKFELIDELSVIPIEDSFWGHKILVFYVPHNHVVDSDLNEKIDNYAIKHLTSIEMPDEYICVDKFPRTSIGKVLKKDLINIYNKNISN